MRCLAWAEVYSVLYHLGQRLQQAHCPLFASSSVLSKRATGVITAHVRVVWLCLPWPGCERAGSLCDADPSPSENSCEAAGSAQKDVAAVLFIAYPLQR